MNKSTTFALKSLARVLSFSIHVTPSEVRVTTRVRSARKSAKQKKCVRQKRKYVSQRS